jgi:arginine utilization protein RocB
MRKQYLEIEERIKELTLDLVSCRSIVGTTDEIAMSEKVYQIFSGIDYWKENPQLLKRLPFINDPLGRFSVVASLKGAKSPGNKTVVMIGHTDTVGISDYGDFRDLATQPDKLIEALKNVTLSDDARKDLESGNWLFGRGILDMKCGVAIIIAIMEHISKEIENFEGNIVFAAVGDEEGNSGGMLAFVPELIRLQEQEGYDYLAVIDTDYTAPRYENDMNRYIYIGTVGKLMPSFYVVGKETHVGEPFNGLDPNQIAGAIIQKINKNVAYSDVADGEVSLPPITLQQRDLKEEYSVQIAKTVNLYFNYATHKSTPDEIMDNLLEAAREAFSDVINLLNERYNVYCKASGMEFRKLPWKARAMTFQELYEEVKAERGDSLDRTIAKVKAKLLQDSSIDERLFGQKIIEEVHGMWSCKDPVVILYYSPPYYPHNYVRGSTKKEAKLLDAIEHVTRKHEGRYKILNRKFYPYISDLSFASAPGDDRIQALENNMPAYGTRYILPIREMQKLALPVVNIGPYGKDSHQFTERIDKEYSFKVTPTLVYETIIQLMK